ncbi:MAG: DNA mismatch repair protein MutL, partial [Bacteroidales bacterium]|nr:DNA mismatch repair protein MutL [Bacteroidales bacterium]
VMMAYDNIIPPDTQASYFLYFDIDPARIDINIHPTKTEIKFEDSPAVFQMIRAAVKEALGKYNVAYSIDFDQEGAVDIPVLTKDTPLNTPGVDINPNYNPFELENEGSSGTVSNNSSLNFQKEKIPENWESLYDGLLNGQAKQQQLFNQSGQNHQEFNNNSENIFLLKNKYIVTTVKSGLMIIHKRRAQERILYEQFLANLQNQQAVSQVSLFPVSLNLDVENANVLLEISESLKKIGFDIQKFGKNSFVINASPSFFEHLDPVEVITQFLESYKITEGNIEQEVHEKIAISMAKAAVSGYQPELTSIEMRELIDILFTCSIPNHSPTGKNIIKILKIEELDNMF